MVRYFAACLAAAVLCACGGGDEVGATAAAPAAGAVAMPQPLLDGLRAAVPPHMAALAGAPLSATEAFDWAEANFPGLFPESGKTSGVLPPYTYRYYPGTGNYLGVAGSAGATTIYLYGPASGGKIRSLGPLDGFTCQIKPQVCVIQLPSESVTLNMYEGGPQTDVEVEIGVPPIPGYLSAVVSGYAPWLSTWWKGTTTLVLGSVYTPWPESNPGTTVTLYYSRDGVLVATKNLAVNASFKPGLIAPPATQATLDMTHSLASLAGGVSVLRGDGTQRPLTASSSEPWLLLTPSGSTSQSLTYTFDSAAVSALQNFEDHTATVTLASPDANTTSFTVTLSKRLPYVDLAMPYGIPAGKASRIVIHGGGFTQFNGTPPVTGASLSNVVVQSDRLLTASVTPSAAGSFPMRLNYAGGTLLPPAQLNVAASNPYGTASIAVTGNKTGYVHDPMRQAVYAVDWRGNALYKYKKSGNTWAASALALTQPLTLALTPDGKRLLVALSDSLKEVDPDQLTVTATYPVDSGISDNFWEPLAVSADQRVWLPNGLRYFDLRDNTVKPLPADSPVDVGVAVAPADGAKVILQPCYCFTPVPPSYQYNTTDGTVTSPMGSLELGYWLQVNTDGTRFMQQDSGTLYDEHFELLGQLPDADANAGESHTRSLLMPDGKRIVTMVTVSYWQVPVRFDVFSTTSLTPGTTRFAKAGSIALGASSAACDYYDGDCSTSGALLAADNSTFFWIGNKLLQIFKLP